ncbi:hypothetical protein BI040_gp60 [Escherichia phage vB_EcoS_NBD2]|uniref:Uncharacterized protein n=1 Tax=Escherichia phage vB_EcoS_NBD2 TaxID=1852563 RepID=A0A192Y7T3_9CAUD|nr:hypothetical protein BI040_gp60 [Escherichia phage vB_EcoS_NBD2]ANM45894.1 hypothetical protein NBD2_52 [Escherichia phage vB_EcoS_NBD2]
MLYLLSLFHYLSVYLQKYYLSVLCGYCGRCKHTYPPQKVKHIEQIEQR